MLLAFSKIHRHNHDAELCRLMRIETAELSTKFRKRTDELLKLLEEMKHDNQESVDRLKSEG